MSILAQVVQAVLSAGWGWYFFLASLFDYSRNLSWYPYLITAGWISMFFLFLKIVRQGEEGYLKFVAWDLNTLCKEGAYWPLNLFPFLQGIYFAAGFTVVLNRLSTLGSIAGNPGIRHNYDQNMSSLQFRATTDSLAKASFYHNLNRLMIWLFSFWDAEGRFRYYKLGSYLYLSCWLAAFIGNLGNHATRVTNQIIGTINSAVSSAAQTYAPPDAVSKKTVTVTIQLDTGIDPQWPDWELFIPTREKGIQYYEMVEGKKYYVYSEPTPESVNTIRIKEPACAAIPIGREVSFRTLRIPVFAANMEDKVTYMEKKYWITLGEWSDSFMLEEKKGVPWEYVHTNWDKVETSHNKITSQAKLAYELPEPAGGGLVCF